MRIISRAITVTALVAGSLLAIARPADAATINVGPGQSIQAAVNRAEPGDTIRVAAGVYRENVTIRKDNLKLVGAGDAEDGTVLRPPAEGTGLCSEPDYVSAFCVLAKKVDQNFTVITPVTGVSITGFLIQNFSGDGILTYGANNTSIVDNTAARNGGYGFASFVSNGNLYNQLVARNNVGPGFYIGDSPNSEFILKNSFAVGNELGILIREANNGKLVNNVFSSNCAGVFMLNHGNAPDLDIRVQNWWIHDNKVESNNKVCTEPGGGDSFGGIGIALLGPKDVLVENNTILENKAASGPGGGLALLSSASDGGNPPVGNTIRANTFGDNRPFDILYDGSGSGNTFPGNRCNSSQPAHICD